jgi:hypothetical protein
MAWAARPSPMTFQRATHDYCLAPDGRETVTLVAFWLRPSFLTSRLTKAVQASSAPDLSRGTASLERIQLLGRKGNA